MRLLYSHLKRFASCERGVALIEFAYCITLLMLLLWGGIEFSRYVLTVQKLEDAANQETTIIGTTNPKAAISQGEMDSILHAVSLMMSPYSFDFNDSNNTVIITDIYAPQPTKVGATPVGIVQWRYCSSSGSAGASTRSKLGAIGSPADLSQYPGFTMAVNDEVIVAEIYYKFTPVINNFLTTAVLPKVIYTESMSVPRFGLLTQLVGTSFPSNCP